LSDPPEWAREGFQERHIRHDTIHDHERSDAAAAAFVRIQQLPPRRQVGAFDIERLEMWARLQNETQAGIVDPI
jgi:hypothetical protein